MILGCAVLKGVFEKSADSSPQKSQFGVVDRTTHRFGTRPVSFVSDKNPAFGATFFRGCQVILSFGLSKKRHRRPKEQRRFQRTSKIDLHLISVILSGPICEDVGGGHVLLWQLSRVVVATKIGRIQVLNIPEITPIESKYFSKRENALRQQNILRP